MRNSPGREKWKAGSQRQPKWHLVADPVNADGMGKSFADGNRGTGDSSSTPCPRRNWPPTRRSGGRRRTTGAALLPAEFTDRYHQQFVDRLWLRGLLAATGILYAIGVMIYFGATTLLNYKTVAPWSSRPPQLGDSYTNVLQLKARYEVLTERERLKYAALDCWKIVADNCPPASRCNAPVSRAARNSP